MSDANGHLIHAYKQIREQPEKVARLLAQIADRDSAAFYYSVRELYNKGGSPVVQAARFIYLNRTCFNGVFRVNKQDQFNVPYGHRARPWFPDEEQLSAFGKALRQARLLKEDYRSALARTVKGDFVYLDPPYPPLNGTSNFAHYTMDRFNIEEQSKLAEEVKKLDRKGCLVMMSNADTKLIRELYRSFRVRSLEVTRYVTCKSRRHRVRELIICNY